MINRLASVLTLLGILGILIISVSLIPLKEKGIINAVVIHKPDTVEIHNGEYRLKMSENHYRILSKEEFNSKINN